MKHFFMRWLAITAIIIAVVVAIWLGFRQINPSMSLERNDRIDITPQQIMSIRDIGQWEFLSVSDEELIDTVRRGVFTDDHLSRIYYGTLRLGIDMQQLSDDAFVVRDDTLMVTLPPVGLLDDHFIDEARTRSFHESGRWQAADREAFYARAHQRMLSQALTPRNIKAAQTNGEAQVHKLLTAMGFKHVIIRFEQQR